MTMHFVACKFTFLLFLNLPSPASLSFIVWSLFKQINVKIVHSVSGTGIQTHEPSAGTTRPGMLFAQITTML